MVIETISYFMRNGSEVFTCCMDMTKAFDLVCHSLLFRKLLQAGLPTIFIRLLLVIYLNQFANVKWNNSFSSMFTLRNGVRQGGVLSAILYCLYVDGLFKELRKSGYGCWVNGNYHGIFGYSDDNMLLAPSQYALQEMLKICEQYASEHNLQFSTNPDPVKCKTKCIPFLKKQRNLNPIVLCGNNLPWVDEFKHLGNHFVNAQNFTKQDVKIKRAQSITKKIELNQEFYFCHPETKLEIDQIFNSHYTGSPLWNLTSEDVIKLESSYNTNVKIVFDLPYDTHWCLIEPITGRRHLRIILMKRFMSFVSQIKKSTKQIPKQMLRIIREDVRSTTGSNLRSILHQTQKVHVDHLQTSDVLQLEYHPVQDEDKWKIHIIKEILSVKSNTLEVDEFNDEDLSDILNHLCSE